MFKNLIKKIEKETQSVPNTTTTPSNETKLPKAPGRPIRNSVSSSPEDAGPPSSPLHSPQVDVDTSSSPSNLQMDDTGRLNEKITELENRLDSARKEHIEEVRRLRMEHLGEIQKLKLEHRAEMEKVIKLNNGGGYQDDEGRLLENAKLSLEESKRVLIGLEHEREMMQLELLKNIEENGQNQNLVRQLRSENSQLLELKDKLTVRLREMENNCRSLEVNTLDSQDSLKCLQETYESMMKRSERTVEEKSNEIISLKEKVTSLEERVGSATLSDDEKYQALESERKKLESRLEESREQLASVKANWSDKINHMETQIGTLKEKLVNSQRSEDATKKKLQDSEKAFRSAKIELEGELNAWKKEAKSVEETSKRKLSEKEAQHNKEKKELETKLAELEMNLGDQLEKEIESEKANSTLGLELAKAKDELRDKAEASGRFSREVGRLLLVEEDLKSRVASLQQDLNSSHEKLKHQENVLAETKREYDRNLKEKEESEIRNSTLSQQLHVLRRDQNEEITTLKAIIEEEEKRFKLLECEFTQSQLLVERLQAENVKAGESEAHKEEIQHLREEIDAINSQLLEKNKTIKVQVQHLANLKKTLQKELKSKSLPNDQVLIPELELESRAPSTFSSYAAMEASESSMQKHRMPDHFQLSKYPRSASSASGNAQEEINFEYLKHVVLKFMTCKEYEALQLIKAVGTVLRCSPEEESLLRDTIVWKMSWFGSKPGPKHRSVRT